MSVTVRAQVAHFGAENVAPGDILLTNDSCIHDSHLNHMVFTLPSFFDGEVGTSLVASTLSRAVRGRIECAGTSATGR